MTEKSADMTDTARIANTTNAEIVRSLTVIGASTRDCGEEKSMAEQRLIDAYKLMQAMYDRAFETDGDTMWQSGCWVRYRAVEQVIRAQPTIEERKTGKWIRTDKTDIVDGKHINWVKWNCSECGVEKKIGWAKGVKFCPNCGASMMEGEQP